MTTIESATDQTPTGLKPPPIAAISPPLIDPNRLRYPPSSGRVLAESWDVPVEVAQPERVDPRHLHSVVSRRMDDGVGSDHRAASKRYAVGALWQRTDGRPGFALRLLGAASPILSRTEAVKLGRQVAHVDWAGATPIDRLTIEDLVALKPAKSVLVRFLTPMTRRRGDHYLPNPTPEGILGSWERAAGLVGLDGHIDWRAAEPRIAHLDGHTTEWSPVKGPWRRKPPVGFVGDVALVVAPDYRRRLHQLATIAAFAGTGAHTTFGMGFTELVAVEEVGP